MASHQSVASGALRAEVNSSSTPSSEATLSPAPSIKTQGAESTKGTASVYWHDNRGPENAYGHYSIKISDGENILHTHQKGGPGGPTMIGDDLSRGVPASKSAEFDLSNPTAAQPFQKAELNKICEAYDLKNKSCITHVCDVLREGGVNVPKEPGAQLKFLKRMLKDEAK